jgi:hypothetical protein
MYFFLRNFSFLEISFTTVSIPRFLMSILTGDKIISYNGCATQIFFFIFRSYWVLSLGCYVLWSLCHYLQTSALPNHYEQ